MDSFALDTLTHAALGAPCADSPVALCPDLEARWLAARGAFPELDVSAALFAKRLSELAGADLPNAAYSADLYLAIACTQGNAMALATFEREYGALILRTARSVNPNPAFCDDVLQVMRQSLFAPLDRGSPKIAEYGGRAPLRNWLRVVTKRAALKLVRGADRTSIPPDTDEAVSADAAPELSYMKALYKDRFEAATRDAFRALSSRERTLLRLHLGERMTLVQLGSVYDVSHATVARWLAAARNTLIAHVRRSLTERLSLSPSDYGSMAALVRSHLEVQILDLLCSGYSNDEAAPPAPLGDHAEAPR